MPEEKPLTKSQKKKVHQAVVQKMTTLILAGFGLVAALAWNDAIKSLFETIFGKQQSLIAKFLYAIFITAIIVVISIKLRSLMKRVVKKEKKL